MTTQSSTRAVIYCRISEARDDERGGVDRQRLDGLNLAQRNGWTVVHDGDADTFTDNDISGAKDESGRPAFARMIAAIRAGKVDAVIAYSQARIYRDAQKFLGFCELLKTHNVETLALILDSDVNPGGSLFVATVIAAKDAEERRRIGELVTRKHLENAQTGKPHGGSRCFGFEKDGITHRPAEVELIREAARRVLEGETLSSIRLDWNTRGVPSTTGKPWASVTVVKRTMTTPRVAGLRVHQGAILEDVETAWEPILDRTTWEQLCAILNDPSRRTSTAPSRDYPLTGGILTCALCGQPLKAMPKTGKRSYGCNKKTGGCNRVFVRADPIERYVRRTIVPVADSPAFLDEVFAVEAEQADEARELVIANAADERRLAELDDMLADGDMDRASYTRSASRIRERIAGRTAQLAGLRGQSALGRYAGHVEESWDTMPVADQRLILLALIESVQIASTTRQGSNAFDTTRVGIRWRYENLARLSGEDFSVEIAASSPAPEPTPPAGITRGEDDRMVGRCRRLAKAKGWRFQRINLRGIVGLSDPCGVVDCTVFGPDDERLYEGNTADVLAWLEQPDV